MNRGQWTAQEKEHLPRTRTWRRSFPRKPKGLGCTVRSSRRLIFESPTEQCACSGVHARFRVFFSAFYAHNGGNNFYRNRRQRSGTGFVYTTPTTIVYLTRMRRIHFTLSLYIVICTMYMYILQKLGWVIIKGTPPSLIHDSTSHDSAQNEFATRCRLYFQK